MKIHHIAITVKDLENSIKFYKDFFDFKEIKRFRKDDMGTTGVMLEAEGFIIELFKFDVLKEGHKEDLSITGIKHFAFFHKDPASVRSLFIEKGLICSDIKIGASGGIYFFTSDPEDNQIEIYKPVEEISKNSVYFQWNILKQNIEVTNRKFFSKGEVWFMSIGKNIGDEEDGKNENFERPVVVLRKFNNNIFLGVPLTSQVKEGKFYQKLYSFKSNAILSQVRLFDAKRLIRNIGKLDTKELNLLKENIRKLI